ncbi:MAG: hypothetical protein OEZ39_10520 [Gammaproteobacteria bacterium]|nr:hypothetical protein [Gammaproteobacteria bacterium]
MNAKPLLYIVCLLMVLCATASTLHAEEMQTTTLQLNHRQADDVISYIKPFLHPEGIINGEDFTISVKTTAKNLNDLQQLIAEIDIAQRELLISVAVSASDIRTIQDNAASTDKPSKDQVYTTQRDEQSVQISQVRVSEGQWATIKTGDSIPIRKRIRNPDGTVTESIAYKSVQSGFRILPHIQHDKVRVFIQPQAESFTSGDKTVSRMAETTLNGKLGEWLLVGGVQEAKPDAGNAEVYATRRYQQHHQNIFVKIEVVPNN